MIAPGSRVRVLPAYEMATRARTRRDEWTDLEGTIERVEGSDVLVTFARARDAWIHVMRLEDVAPAPWPLHGARTRAELDRVIAALAAWARASRRLPPTNGEAYAHVGAAMGLPTSTVSEIARNYQSLWLAP